MKIEQQNQIKEFLNEEFGVDKGKELFNKQEMILDEIIKNIKNKSENQRKTLIQTILPRIALYKAMLQNGLSKEEVYQHMQTIFTYQSMPQHTVQRHFYYQPYLLNMNMVTL